MLLLIAWWLFTVAAYVAGIFWEYYYTLISRELAEDSTHTELATSRIARYENARNNALRVGTGMWALSMCCIILHFTTPRTPISLGLLGNSTL